MNIKFTIIIPTYNRAELLKEALQSLMDQDYSNFEVIVVDDGGADNSEEVVNAFNDDRIKYFWKENEERSIARNFGISHASGDYIGFLDSDDFHLPQHLSTSYKLISADFPPIIILGTEYRTYDDKLLFTQNDWSEDMKSKILKKSFLPHNSLFVKSEILKKYQFIPRREAVFAEDWYLWIRLALRYKFKFSREITSIVREHKKRSLNALDPYKVEKSVLIVVEYLFRDSEFLRLEKKIIDNILIELYLSTAMIFLKNGLKKKARKYFLLTINKNPSLLFKKRAIAIIKLFIGI